jgi:dTDP-4-dehydrorhamnose 3,5-epimerase
VFDFEDTPLEGLKRVTPRMRPDARGWFVKLFHAPSFAEAGLCTEFREQYCSLSYRNVLRGMHFQLPPHDHAKLVYCLSGRVLDVALDLRRGSPTYGQSFSTELDGSAAGGLYLPRGFAHGFLALSDEAVLSYHVETPYAPDADTGVLWSGFGFEWPAADPLVSPRDAGFSDLASFQSPF